MTIYFLFLISGIIFYRLLGYSYLKPGPSAVRLEPRAFSTGVVVSLGEGFVWIDPLDITALKRLEYGGDLFRRTQ